MKINLYHIMLCAALIGLISADIVSASDATSSGSSQIISSPPSPTATPTAGDTQRGLSDYLNDYGWYGLGAGGLLGAGRISKGLQTGALRESLGNLSPYLSEARNQLGYGIGALGRGASALTSGIGSGLGYGAGALGATARHAWEAAAPETWIQKAIPQIIQQAPTKLSAWEAAKLAARQGLGAGYNAYTRGIQQAPTYLMPKTGEYDAYIGAAIAAAAALPLLYKYRESLAGAGSKITNFIPGNIQQRVTQALTLCDAKCWYDKAREATKQYKDKDKNLTELNDKISKTSPTDYDTLRVLLQENENITKDLDNIAKTIEKCKQYAIEGVDREIDNLTTANETLDTQIRTITDRMVIAGPSIDPNLKNTLESNILELEKEKEQNTKTQKELKDNLKKDVENIVVPQRTSSSSASSSST